MSTFTFKSVKSLSRIARIFPVAVAASGVLCGVFFGCVSAFSEPTTSPSAIAAARLKYRPPDNWIRHYLGDDRYKIAGNIWKFVSTTTDQYYHRPDSPFMLSQPAGIVIGFASAREAEEAGYLPGPSVNAIVLPSKGGDGTGDSSGRNGQSGSAARGVQILLTDGRSTAILPAGWTRAKIGSTTDTLLSSGRRGGVIFVFMTMPNNMNLEPFMSPQGIQKFADSLSKGGDSNNAFAEALRKGQVKNARVGGRRGVAFTAGPGTRLPGDFGSRVYLTARGSKLYIMGSTLPEQDAGVQKVFQSFQPR